MESRNYKHDKIRFCFTNLLKVDKLVGVLNMCNIKIGILHIYTIKSNDLHWCLKIVAVIYRRYLFKGHLWNKTSLGTSKWWSLYTCGRR